MHAFIRIPVDNPLDERFNRPVFLADTTMLLDSSTLSSFLVRCLNTAKWLTFFSTPLMFTSSWEVSNGNYTNYDGFRARSSENLSTHAFVSRHIPTSTRPCIYVHTATYCAIPRNTTHIATRLEFLQGWERIIPYISYIGILH